MTNIANMHCGASTVAFYDTLGADAGKYIMNQTELITMVISNDYVKNLCKWKKEDEDAGGEKMHRLKNLVCFEAVSEEDRGTAEAHGLTIYSFEEVINRGREYQASNPDAKTYDAKRDDTYMFSYTSGTTGDPKGVMLTHQMIIGAAYAVNMRLGANPFNEDDTYISYLPAAHSFEQAVFGLSAIYGMKAGFFGGNVLKLTEDMSIL